jgi:hypothetical protein
MKRTLVFFLFFILLASCYRMRKSKGGGQISTLNARTIEISDIALHPGYSIEAVASGLNFPTGITFDDQGRPYVIEAGYSYGEVWTEPKLLRLENDGKSTLIAKGSKNGPWTGVSYFNGSFYIAEGGQLEGGKILKIDENGAISELYSGLPSFGDHHTNGPAIKDGYIYFGQGTATNSGVVGPDNFDFGWLKRKQEFHDIPCSDVVLTGKNFESGNPLTDDPNDKVSTGAFVPFGTSTQPGQVIKGSVPCNGAVMRIPLSGGNVELVAWGFRNPFGLSFSPSGILYLTDNGFDERGNRSVWGTADVLWEVKQGSWYGWPDHSAGISLHTKKDFEPPAGKEIEPLLQSYPSTPPKPVASLGVHSSSNGFDFSFSDAFGFKGEAFIAQLGDMSPNAGKVLSPVGFKVVRADPSTGIIRDFAVNKGKRNGPASWLGKGGLERPVDAQFNKDGTSLYIVDFGVIKMSDKGAEPQENSGVVWRITRKQ